MDIFVASLQEATLPGITHVYVGNASLVVGDTILLRDEDVYEAEVRAILRGGSVLVLVDFEQVIDLV